METSSTYWNDSNVEITEAEYNTLADAGKKFSLKGCRTQVNSQWVYHQKYIQHTPTQQSQREVEETASLAAQPWLTDLAAMKTFMIELLSKKVAGRYSRHIDKHHAKKTRRDRKDGPVVDVPTAVTDYEDALELAWTNIKVEINAKTTIPDIHAYVVGKNGNTAWPNNSAVKNL
jgi:hypothetical protein